MLVLSCADKLPILTSFQQISTILLCNVEESYVFGERMVQAQKYICEWYNVDPIPSKQEMRNTT